MKIEGKINHHSSNNGIVFIFSQIDEKNSKKEEVDVYTYMDFDIPFEIWKRFKDNKVKITIEKA